MANIDMAKYMRERRKNRRDDLIARKGRRCQVCASEEALEFDHRQPETKSFVLSGRHLDGNWDRILQELEKCDLLCKECHRDKTVANGETGGGQNKNTAPYRHGVMRTYQELRCRCSECKKARRDYREKIVPYFVP